MFIETWILLLALFLVLVIAFGGVLKFYVKPSLEKEMSEKNADLEAKVLQLNQQLGAFQGAEKLEQVWKTDRIQNVAVMKTRALIVDFAMWEKPSRLLRIWLSLITSVVAALGISNFIRGIQEMENVDFWALGILMFMVAYYFWGSVIETTWKQKRLDLMRKEFLRSIQLSSNPLKMRDELLEWMTSSLEVADPVRRLLEGLFDKWLRQNLEMK